MVGEPKAALDVRPRRLTMKIAGLSALGVGLLGASLLQPTRPLLVWNASASVPIGLYRIDRRAPAVGNVALVRLGEPVANLAKRRAYLPSTAFLLKPVVAWRGDRVCRLGSHILARGRHVGRALARDAVGRRLPSWRGCRTLGAEELFLFADRPDSFDSRYFGPIGVDQVIGFATPVWPTPVN